MARWLGLVCGLVVVSAAPVAALDITACGQTVPVRGKARLVTDLICPPGAPAIVLGNKARLRLDGHTVSGGSRGIECAESCKIHGPGSLTGAQVGIFAQSAGRVKVKDVDVSGNSDFGIQVLTGDAGLAKLTALDVVASGNGSTGIVVNPYLRGRNITANDNGGEGVRTCLAVIKNLQANNNAGQGLVGCGAKLTASTLTGNDAAGAGIDVLTTGVPTLKGTSCGKSAALLHFENDGPVVGDTHGVCTND